ncbi:CBBY-like protein [Bidens hawaiensis]|uniref:CBBY-like protein n=1 Tax=Bidens hawaiensis TaxID=980011 RepID=UPI00404A92BA
MASIIIHSSSCSTSSVLHSHTCNNNNNNKQSVVQLHQFRSSVFPDALVRFSGSKWLSPLSGTKLRSGFKCAAGDASVLPSALLFDCDGVLVDTEKDGHRVSFNDTFTEKELGVTWDVDLYGELLKIGGGKERMTAYFNKTGWPENAPKGEQERKDFIASLHKRKTDLFMVLIEKKLLPLRPGVAKLIDQAFAKGVKVAVCSTSNEKAVSAIVSFLLGPERAAKIQIFAGDVVPRKKPDPAIYNLAATTLGVEPSRCVVVEDSGIGLAAAKAAGMTCIVTKSGYTADEDFENADAAFDCIGDPPEERFDLDFCTKLLQKQYV